MSLLTECAAALLSFRYPSIFSVSERMVLIKQSIMVLSVEKQWEGSLMIGISLKQQINIW